MKPLVSVILPVYNVEPYFEQCMKSVLDQTLREIEIILVDDGSPDGCPQMCDRFAAEDSRVRLHHQKNAGVSVARNVGIEMAQGDWIMFVDPDDWLELDAVEVLYREAVKMKCEVVFASCIQHYVDEQKDGGVGDPNVKHLYSMHEYRTYLLGACFVTPHKTPRLFPKDMQICTRTAGPCMKLFHTESIRSNDVKFPAGVAYGEDTIFNLNVFLHSNRVGYVNKRIYHQRMRGGSAVDRALDNGQERKLLLYDFFNRFAQEHGLTDMLSPYQNLRIATDMILLMQYYSQNTKTMFQLFLYSMQLSKIMRHPAVKKMISEIQMEDIQKYKPLFRLLKLKLPFMCILVYRIRYLWNPKKYGKQKFS